MSEPHFFLIEDDLDRLETWRRFAANHRRDKDRAVKALRETFDRIDIDERERARLELYVDVLALQVDSLQTWFVAGLDARTAELTDEAIGYDAGLDADGERLWGAASPPRRRLSPGSATPARARASRCAPTGSGATSRARFL